MLPRPALLLALFVALLAADAGAQRAQPAVGVAPPLPVPLAVKVRREGRTEIPLRIYGRAGEPLKYLIRTPPEHGKLSEPRPTEREAAVVVYEPPADLAITGDRFFYAAQSALGVSASVEIKISITDRPPQLGIVDTIEFSTTRAGQAQSRTLEISNKGGLVATGEVIVDAPWRIEGRSDYRLRAGEAAVFKVVFAPTAGGSFEGVARYTSDPEHSTTLRGAAETAITATPAQVILRQEPGDAVRTGAFELANQTDEPRTLSLKSDARLLLPPQVTVPPRGKIAVPIQTAAGDTRALATEIRLEAPDFTLTVPVKALAPGAFVRVAPPALNFGPVPAGRAAGAGFELENLGGTSGEVTWEIGAPFRLAQKSVLLTPGEKRRFTVELESKIPGKLRAWVQFKAGAQSFELPVEAEVQAAARPPGSVTAGPGRTAARIADQYVAAATAPSAPDDPAAPFTPAVPVEWFGDRKLPPGVKITNLTATSAQLEWPASLSSATSFRLEMRQLRLDPQRKLQVSWLAPEGVPIERRGAQFVATLTGLQPAQPWTVRILPLNAAGEPEARLFAIDFKTPPKSSFFPRPTLLHGLLAALVALVGWQVWRRFGRRA